MALISSGQLPRTMWVVEQHQIPQLRFMLCIICTTTELAIAELRLHHLFLIINHNKTNTTTTNQKFGGEGNTQRIMGNA
jgi:hypothetical protein